MVPIIVSRYTLAKQTGGLLYPLFNATGAEVTIIALPFNTSAQVEHFIQFAMLKNTAKIARLEEEPQSHWMDSIKTRFLFTTVWPISFALLTAILFLYDDTLLEQFKHIAQGVRNKAATIVEDVLYRTHRAREVDRRRLQEARDALDRMSDECSRLNGENVRLDQRLLNTIAELTRLRPLEGRLQEAVERADNYLRDVERYRNEMRDARNEADGIRTALTEALTENHDLKRDLNQLTTSAESGANESRHLHDQLDAERAKSVESLEQIRALQNAVVERETEITLLKRKEEELKEVEQSLREERLINMTLNSDIEEMRRLILESVERNAPLPGAETTNMETQGNASSLRLAAPPGFASSPSMPADPVNSGPINATGLEDFVNAVYATLFSSPQGYAGMGHLLRDLDEDAGIDGDAMASRFGYQNLEAFLRSSSMASKFVVTANAQGGAVYKARPNETNLHLHREQQIGFECATNRRIKSAVNKAVARERVEKDRLRSRLALSEESVEEFKAKLLKFNSMQTSSRFRKSMPGEDQPTTSRASLTQSASPAASGADDDHPAGLTLLCSICFERPPATATATVYNCGHCFCYQCIVGWREREAHARARENKRNVKPLCPSCREPIDDIIRIYGE